MHMHVNAQVLTSQLLFRKPEEPRAFIVEYLENVKLHGTDTLINRQDLATMFGMFDVVKRGVITADQAAAALRSILGPSADLEAFGVQPTDMLTQERFVDCMEKALQSSVPYKK